MNDSEFYQLIWHIQDGAYGEETFLELFETFADLLERVKVVAWFEMLNEHEAARGLPTEEVEVVAILDDHGNDATRECYDITGSY